MFLNNYLYILLNETLHASMFLALSIFVLFISLIQCVNGAQFLNTTWIFLFPPPANAENVIVPLRSIHDHYNHINLNFTLKF